MVKWKRQILKVIGYAAQFVAVKPVIGLGRVLNFSRFLLLFYPFRLAETTFLPLQSLCGFYLKAVMLLSYLSDASHSIPPASDNRLLHGSVYGYKISIYTRTLRLWLLP